MNMAHDPRVTARAELRKATAWVLVLFFTAIGCMAADLLAYALTK